MVLGLIQELLDQGRSMRREVVVNLTRYGVSVPSIARALADMGQVQSTTPQLPHSAIVGLMNLSTSP